MFSLKQLSVALITIIPHVLGATIPTRYTGSFSDVVRRDDPSEGPDCKNGPGGRGHWCKGFGIDQDYDLKCPKTGQSLTYDLRISRKRCNPDGAHEKDCLLINGQYPGPTIRAKWGDTVRIVVHNDIPDNGTSIHWHGLRQLNSCTQDGVNGVTECPIAPGSTKTYEWKATQYGTSWYHSHHSAQYGEGIVGPIVIDGPTTADYDVDLGPLPLTDWFYDSAWVLNYRAVHTGIPPPQQNILINGTMKGIDATGKQTGKYNKITVEKGKTYKLRLINTAVDHFFHVSMDGHPFTVVAADLVPIVPKKDVTDLKMSIGQRYDIIFKADQDVANYWLRVTPGCGESGKSGKADIYSKSITVGAIIQYKGAPDAEPKSQGYSMAPTCEDEVFEPYWKEDVPKDQFINHIESLNLTFGPHKTSMNDNVMTWFINGSTMDVDWAKPTLQYVLDGNTNSFPANLNLFEVNGKDAWTYWVIQNVGAVALPHPIHLHGHDFWVLGSGPGAFDMTTNGLNFNNPVRRDVATLPENGHLVLAFPADNPGAWVMHCHIAWHASQGLSVQFLERKDEIVKSIGNFDSMKEGCREWNNYWKNPAFPDEDSGI